MVLPSLILERIETLRRNLESYVSPDYKETQLRREFLDPFFEALGWDVQNKQGYAEAYKDVIHEDTLRISDLGTKAPDYSFRIGGARKFFVEAKKPAVSIKDDPEPAQQLRRYSWSAKLPLGILTDFHEFAIYDTRIKPLKNDPPHKGRVFYCKFEEYAQKWGEIAGIFSRDAVLKGSFDRYAVSVRGKRGTASVDEDFLGTLNEWRLCLAKNLALRNAKLSQRELNFAVQRILDRIIFLRIAEDRGIEHYGQLLGLTGSVRVEEDPDEETDDTPASLNDLTVAEPAVSYHQRRMTVYPRLCEIFERADFRYNSGLFQFHAEKDRNEAPDLLTLRLHIDDLVLRDIIVGLYYPESPYVFSVIASEILGHVYEQFLGKVIRLTEGHRAVVEDKPEVRKAGGVYYTPTYIVDYIVCQTVGPLVADRTPKQIEKLRILDPACGSGSFLLGAFQFLLDWHLRYYVGNDPRKWARQKAPPIYETAPNALGIGRGSGNWQLTVAERKRILVNNLYGVDIDAQAVEVTKLSLLLKVLEGEARELRGKQTEFHRVLPDLGKNIKCGNSLIGSDFYRQLSLPDLDDEARYRINAFDWEHEFTGIMKAGGFDAVIGNPPYVNAWEFFSSQPELREFINSSANYRTADRHWDLYVLFFERAWKITKKNARFAFIVPYSYAIQKYALLSRRLVLSECTIESVADFRTVRVFGKVPVITIIPVVRKSHPPANNEIVVRLPVLENKEVQRLVNSHRVRQGDLLQVHESMLRLDLTHDRLELIQKLERGSVRLGKICYVNYGAQMSSKEKGAFGKDYVIRVKKENQSCRPVLSGRELFRYSIRWEGRFVDYSFAASMYGARWPEFFELPKLMIRDITGTHRIESTLDLAGFYCDHTILCALRKCDVAAWKIAAPEEVIRSKNIELPFLAAVVASRLQSFFYYLVLTGEGVRTGGGFHTYPETIRDFLVPDLDLKTNADKKRHDELAALAKRILKLHEGLAAARMPNAQTQLQREIEQTDRAIDQLVYQLYELTPDEIAIVERATA